MKRILLIAALLAAATASTAHGQTRGSVIIDGDKDSPAYVIDRMLAGDARFAMVSGNGELAMMIDDDAVIVQFTDRGLGKIGREMEEERESGLLGRMVAALVRNSVRTLLDHAVAYPISELQDARYDGERLVLTDREGKQVFENVEVNGTDLVQGFSARDARAFVAHFRKAKAEQPR